MEYLAYLWIFFIGVISGLLLGMILIYRTVISSMRERIENLIHQKQSLSTTYGKITEQFAPFMRDYPFSPDRFRFIGSPIDGIQFEDDRIIFVEFKAGNSRLSKDQKRIKELVKNKRIDWFEFHIK